MKKHSVFIILIIMLCAVLTALPAFAALPGTEPTSNDIRAHNGEWGFPHGDGVVLVLCGGQVSGVVDPRQSTKEQIGLLMTQVGARKDGETA